LIKKIEKERNHTCSPQVVFAAELNAERASEQALEQAEGSSLAVSTNKFERLGVNG
jgi:hypothetical protein